MAGVSESSPTRPRQVTLAAVMIIVGSVVVVAMVFDQVAGLHTLETRNAIEKFLAEPPGADLGIGTDAVLGLPRTVAMVAAGCATAAAILGYQVLRRSRSARLALTVIAVPLFLTGMVTGGFVSSVVAASAAMLWLQPARDWFDGTTRPSAAAAATASVFATPAPRPGPAPASVVARPAPDAASRPGAVVVACVITWIACGVAAVGMVLTSVLLVLQPHVLLDEVHRQNPDLAAQGVSDRMLVGLTHAMIAGIVLWCLAAMVLGFLAFRGTDWARVLLVISAAASAGLSLLGLAAGAFLLALTLAASLVTIGLLVRRDVRPWFRQRPPA